MRLDLDTLVLAAGESTRIRPVTQGEPKPLLRLGPRTVLEHQLGWLAAQGVPEVTLNLHYRPESIRRALGSPALRVRLVEEPILLGTAGALDHLKDCRRTILVVYGDNLVSFPLAPMLVQHRSQGALATLAIFDQRRHPHTGIAGGRLTRDSSGRILSLEEGAGAGSPLVNAGVYLLEPTILERRGPERPLDFARQLFPRLLEAGEHLQAHLLEGYCLGLDTPESLRIAEALVAEGLPLP